MRRRVVRAGLVALACLLVAACQNTSIPGLNVRAGPTTASAVVATIPESGTPVRIACWTYGEPVYGDARWFRLTGPEVGWVTHYYIRSPRSSIPRC